MPKTSKPPIPIPTKVEVFFRDGWLCSLCHRPTVFDRTLRLLGELVRTRRPDITTAYWDERWRRDRAPLADELAACVDHITAFSRDGLHEISNFATACAKCNARKSDREKADYLKVNPPWRVKGKFGEPKDWDGLSSLFVVLASDHRAVLGPTDRNWLAAIERHFASAKEG
jgi:5-methylcytosine-specific restriction endonuclease McrA